MSNETERPSYGEGREALMSAVMRIVAAKGLRGVTYRAVAGVAGVNHNLISHHFGSIETLLTATMEWAIQRSIENTELALFADLNEHYADALIASVTAEPEVHMFQFEMLLEARRRPELQETSRRLYANYVSSVHAALQSRGIEAGEDLCKAIFASLDGLMLQFLTMGDPAGIRSAVVQLGQLMATSMDRSPEHHES
ncbi:TetR/AcrR family transcriptional regulator [Micrococcus antarcticus]